MSNWNYYTVTLHNKSAGNGVVGGKISYSEVTCGDHLVPVTDCGCLR